MLLLATLFCVAQFESVILQITKLGLNFSKMTVYYAYKLLFFENCNSCLDVNQLFSFRQHYPHIRTCFHSIFKNFYKTDLKIAHVFLEPL